MCGQAAPLVRWFVLVLWADVTLVTSLPPESIFEDVNFIEIHCTYEKCTHLQLDEFLQSELTLVATNQVKK